MKNKFNVFLLICISFIVLCMGIGYATVNNVLLTINGQSSYNPTGILKITGVTLSNSNNLQSSEAPTFTDDSINFNITFEVNSKNDIQDDTNYDATYEIELTNDSFTTYRFESNAFQPSVIVSPGASQPVITYEIDGININDEISPGEVVSFTVTIRMYPETIGTFNISGESNIEANPEDVGSLVGAIPRNLTGNLTGSNTRVKFTASVMNSFNTSKSFELSLNNSNFNILDENGNIYTSKTINANTTEDFDFYIERISGARFPTNNQGVNVFFKPENESERNMGMITIMVDKDPTLTDETAPEISNVTAEQLTTDGSVRLSWNGSDISGVDFYTIETYQVINNNRTLLRTTQTPTNETSYTLTNIPDGAYVFKVYGTDIVGNTASSAIINSCPNSATNYCTSSLNVSFKWTFSVTYNLTNLTTNGASTAKYAQTYQATISAASGYDNATSITITMGGNTIPTSQYQYNSSSGVLQIGNVTGDIVITAEGNKSDDGGTCLAKGTKILLANGKTKNIEDINYDDLLAVWNYDTGSLTAEYPLWIENEHTTDTIIRVTFEDNTYIDIVGNHALYNTDINLFVNLDDNKYFNIGSNMAKITTDGKFIKTKIKNIEKTNKTTTYYFVGTTTYYNIIANNILTTDTNLMISNLYGFTENAKWPDEKENFVNDNYNIIDYSIFKDILPYYLYKGFRVQEAGYLINNNMIDLDSFKTYITSLIINKYMIKDPIKIDNNNYWMVTTSVDNVNDTNKHNFLIKEGNSYKLPSYNNVIGWYNTSDNKIYKPNDIITIYHGNHFIALEK